MATTRTSAAAQRREVPVGGGAAARLRLVVTRRFERPPRFNAAHRLAFFASCLVVAVCLVVVSAQAIVASRQIRIDDLQQQVATAVISNQNLEVQRAALLAPERILSIAEKKLGMVAPSTVTYLVPVNVASVPKPSKALTK